ncbi:MAG TPA: hypothetical protein VF327_02095, partial [Gaiellaceae bacterium]
MPAWLEEIVSEEQLLLPGHSACAGCGPAISMRHVLGGLAAAKPESKIVLVVPASCWTIIAGVFPVNAFGVCVHLTPFASAAAEASGIKAALRLRGDRDTIEQRAASRRRSRLRAGGGVDVAAWLEQIVSEEQLLLPGHSACAGCGPAISMRHVLGALAAARPESKIVLVVPASCWTIIAGVFPVDAFGVAVHLTPFASAAAEASGIKSALRLRGDRDTI